MTQSYLETADIETSSEDYAGRFAGEVGNFFLDLQKDIVLDLLRPYPKPNILDVGGGHAQLAVPMADEGFPVTVTGSGDACRNRLDKLLPNGNFTYKTCDMLHLPFPDKSFDVVLAFRLIPHVSRWQELIAELCRVAKSAVIVDYPDIRSFNFLTSRLFTLKKSIEGNTRPYELFSKKEIIKEFTLHSFESPVSRHEFFLPMVLHRKVGSAHFSSGMEKIFRACGLTGLFGSPVIIRFSRREMT